MAKMSRMWTDYGSKVLVDEKTCQSSPIESADPVLVSEFEQKICTFSKQLTILLQRRARGYDIEHDLFDHELASDEDVAILLWVAFAVAPKWMRISSARDAVGYFLWFCSRCGLYSPNGESHVGVWAEREKSGSGVGSDFDCAWCCFRQDEVKQRGLVHHLDNKEDFYFNFTYGNSAISYGGDKAFDFFRHTASQMNMKNLPLRKSMHLASTSILTRAILTIVLSQVMIYALIGQDITMIMIIGLWIIVLPIAAFQSIIARITSGTSACRPLRKTKT